MFENLAKKFQAVFKNVRGLGRMSEKNLGQALREVSLALLEADVNYRVVKSIVEETKNQALGRKVLESINPGQQFVKVIFDRLVEIMTHENSGLNLAGNPAVVMLAGLQGSGKTTTAAKLAYWAQQNRPGTVPLLVAADVRRPAAAGQLKILGEKAGVETFSGKGNSALTIAADALNYAGTRGINLLIVDTAGRLHIDQELMEELKELKSFLQPRDVLLVLDAMTGQDAVRVAVEFDRQAGIDGAILTKLDGDARGGSAISFRAVTGKPIKLIGVGEKIEDLQVFDPSRAVSRILGMGDVVSLVEKAQQVIDRDESEKLERKWRKARLDLDDFRRQLRQLEKAGGVESMLETLPVGMTGLEDGTFQLKRVGAILDSMTPEERKTPPIIDGSRRVRIARGSGTSVAEVNRVLKQFNLFNKMAGKMGQIDKKKLSLGGVPWQFGSD